MTASSRKLDKFVVRLPHGLRDEIQAAATQNSRSMNAEIVQRLQDSSGLSDISRKLDFVISILRAADPDAYKRFYLQ